MKAVYITDKLHDLLKKRALDEKKSLSELVIELIAKGLNHD
jgi:predicted CopG family antitoxin